MSISTCGSAGVPSVSTIASAWAASDGAGGQPELDPGEQLVGAGLLERHPPLAQGVQPLRVLVDGQHGQPGVGERQRQREADPAGSDDRDVVGHPAPEASGTRH